MKPFFFALIFLIFAIFVSSNSLEETSIIQQKLRAWDIQYLEQKSLDGYEFDDHLIEGSISNDFTLMNSSLFWGCSDESILKAMINTINYSHGSGFLELEYYLFSPPQEYNLFMITRMLRKIRISKNTEGVEHLKKIIKRKILNDNIDIESLDKILFHSAITDNNFVPDLFFRTINVKNKYGYEFQGSVFYHPNQKLGMTLFDASRLIQTLRYVGYKNKIHNLDQMLNEDSANVSYYLFT